MFQGRRATLAPACLTGRVPPSTKAESAAISRLCLPQLKEHLNSANADVLQAFGYRAGGDPYTAYAETWRASPLRCQGNTLGATPVAEEMNYWGHNLVRYRDRFYAIPIDAGPMDLASDEKRLAGFLNADNLAGLRTMVMHQTLTKELKTDLKNLEQSLEERTQRIVSLEATMEERNRRLLALERAFKERIGSR